jgi:hypothetical protein
MAEPATDAVGVIHDDLRRGWTGQQATACHHVGAGPLSPDTTRDDDVWYRASNASGYTNNVFAQTALDGAEILGPDTPAGVRLAQTGRFLTYLGEDLLRRAEYWHAVTFGRSQSEA